MAKALINPEMLTWAVSRAQADVDELAAKLGTSRDRVSAWLGGDDLPTFNQARRLSTVLQIPFGYLYLPQPPEDRIPIAEFRKLPGVSSRVDRDTFDLLSEIDFKRDWYREFRIEEGFEPLEFVARFDLETPTSLVASDIRSELSRVSNSLFSTKKSYERFLDETIKAAERLGIWVMRSGVVGNNTHRPISVESLRGFAVADDIAPIVFLNGKDSKSAQIFTFAHELAHLWIGASSIEFGDLSKLVSNGDKRIETKCNSIAAEILVPSNEFAALWSKDLSLSDQAGGLAEKFNISRVVIARRALEQGYIDYKSYRDFYLAEQNRWAELEKAKTGGGSYYNNVPARNGRTFTKAVAREAAVGRLLYRDAGHLLGIQPSKVRELYERGLN